MQYFYSPNTQCFYIEEANSVNIPVDAIEITEAQHNEFFSNQTSGKYTWELDLNSYEFIYTETQINQEKIFKEQHISEAKKLLLKSDDNKMQYYYSPKSTGFYLDTVHNNMPGDIVKITEVQHEEFLTNQASGKYTWEFDANTNQFIYTEIQVDHEENAKQQRIFEAKQLLIDSDWRAF